MENICAVRMMQNQEYEKPDFRLKKLPHEPVLPNGDAGHPAPEALAKVAGVQLCKHCASFYQELRP